MQLGIIIKTILYCHTILSFTSRSSLLFQYNLHLENGYLGLPRGTNENNNTSTVDRNLHKNPPRRPRWSSWHLAEPIP